MYTEEDSALLRLSMMTDVSPYIIYKLYDLFGSAVSLFEFASSVDTNGFYERTGLIVDERFLSRFKYEDRQLKETKLFFNEQRNISFVPIYSDSYPRLLKETDDAPLLLFCRNGDIYSSQKFITIVGGRSISEETKQKIEPFVRQVNVIMPDVTIVSGCASNGTDLEVHRACFRHNIRHIAVIPNSLDEYDKRNKQFENYYDSTFGAVQITELPTEYSIDDRNRFIRRNRLLSGISNATVIIEGNKGTEITANISMSIGRSVFSFPYNHSISRRTTAQILYEKGESELLSELSQIASVYGIYIK